MLRTFNPLETGTNRSKLSKIYPLFVLRQGRACQLTAQIDGIDRDFLFGIAL